MKSPKSSHSRDPLVAILISYLGKDIHLPKIPGNLNGTYNTPKLYSRSTNDGGTSKRDRVAWCEPLCSRAASLCSLPRSCGANLCVFEPPFLCVTICLPRPTPLLLVQGPSIVNDSTVYFLPPSLADSATFFTLPFSNNPPLLHSWKDNCRTKMMSPFRVLSAFFTTCPRPRFT